MQLENKDRYNVDVYDYSETKNYGLRFELGGSEDLFHYSKDSLDSRFKYQFEIVSPNLPIIKLNNFILTRNNKRDTIPFILYYISDYKSKATLIDTMPFCNDSLQGKRDVFKIIVESSESYHQTKKVYISYDIEIGKERIVRKNIEYRRRWEVDCRPKF